MPSNLNKDWLDEMVLSFGGGLGECCHLEWDGGVVIWKQENSAKQPFAGNCHCETKCLLRFLFNWVLQRAALFATVLTRTREISKLFYSRFGFDKFAKLFCLWLWKSCMEIWKDWYRWVVLADDVASKMQDSPSTYLAMGASEGNLLMFSFCKPKVFTSLLMQREIFSSYFNHWQQFGELWKNLHSI